MTQVLRRRANDIVPVPFPVMIADIGGTNARLAVLPDTHSKLRPFPTVQTAEYDGFAQAADAAVLDATAMMPRALLIALAGPLRDGPMKLTNASWVIDPAKLLHELHLETVIVFNDFEALSLSLPALEGDQIVQIGAGTAEPRQPRVVLGPGTGLGVAALVYGDQSYTPLAGEGGHTTMGPVTKRDLEIWPHLEGRGGRVSGECLLSGDGLVRIFRAVAAVEGVDPTACGVGADVTTRADQGDPVAREAVMLFLGYLGRLSGDLALVFMAKGGVYIAGGIPPRLAHYFEASAFRAEFEAKAPHEALMARIPTFLVTEPRPAVAGLATFATMPERFAIDLSGRRFDRTPA
ncbi:MAG: glucokinase [Pseudomonadota bacterium]